MKRSPILLGGVALALTLPLGAARWEAARNVAEMTAAAEQFLDALTEEQRSAATFSFEAEERFRFHFIPIEMFERQGVMLKEMSTSQLERAHDLLQTGLSQRGYMTANQIMELEDVLLELEGGRRFARDRDEYLFSFFGVPDEGATWGWRFEGHHISLHFTIVEGSVTIASPAFLGANPAHVTEGPQAGRRPLGDREDQGRALIRSLDADQRAVAVIDVEAPRDILTGAESSVDPLSPVGIAYADLDAGQRAHLRDLLGVYLGLMSDEIATARMDRIMESDIERITFAWAGGLEPGEPHYYRLQGPSFLVEYDNTQNGANHIHSVWRDFEGDFGRDLLREHRAQHAHD